MKKFVFVVLALIVSVTSVQAQSFKDMANRIKNNAQQTTERKVEAKAEQTVDNAIDKTFDRIEGLFKKKDKGSKEESGEETESPKSSKNASGSWTCPECGKADNTGNFCDDCGAKKPTAESASASQNVAPAEPASPQAATQKSDFVRGSQQFFFDDVANEKVGEFPSKWDVINAAEEVEVATVSGEKAIKIGGWGSRITPLMKQQYYLGDEFTIEMDVYTSRDNAGGNHSICVDFGDENYSGEFSNELASFAVNTAGNDDARLDYYKTSGADGGDVKQRAEVQESVINKLIKKNAWNTIQISFNTRAMKIYLNGTRIINVPNMAKPKLVNLATWTNSDDPFYYVKNVRVCNGAQELYGKQESTNEVDAAMAATGKFVTNNILFESGKADLKPESMAEIQKVADYMLKNKTVRFEVQGHCDNQGSDKMNDPLSQKRAEAIVDALVKMGVDEWNLRAVGKGSHEPVADNKTEEGRAKNRRVEFIKK